MIGVGNPAMTAVDIAPLISSIVQGLAVLLMAAIAAWVRSHLNDKAAQDTVLRAVENGISFAENHFGATSGKAYTIPMAQGIGATALRYVTTLVPGAVKQMGLDDNALAKIVVAKMPGIERTPLDPSTVDAITAAAQGKAPIGTAPSLDDISKVLLPLIQQAVEGAVAAHYGKAPAPASTATTVTS
jgi:hypothetical protein